MDADGNGSIDFNEFRTALRGWRNKKNKRGLFKLNHLN